MSSRTKTLSAGDEFISGVRVTFTVLSGVDATIEDDVGNLIGTYTQGESYQGDFPQGVFTVASGSIKFWG